MQKSSQGQEKGILLSRATWRLKLMIALPPSQHGLQALQSVARNIQGVPTAGLEKSTCNWPSLQTQSLRKQGKWSIQCMSGWWEQVLASWWAVIRPQIPATEAVTREAGEKEDGSPCYGWVDGAFSYRHSCFCPAIGQLLVTSINTQNKQIGKRKVLIFFSEKFGFEDFGSYVIGPLQSAVRVILVTWNVGSKLLAYDEERRKGRV